MGMSSKIDKEKTKKAIGLILEKIKTEADPWLLNDYHNLFKKEVSLFHRSKVAAYLLMLCDQGKNLHLVERADLLQTEKSSSRKTGAPTSGHRHSAEEPMDRKSMPSTERHSEGDRVSSLPDLWSRRRVPLADEESKRLFFSAGRSRRVFPREILGLINTKTAVSKEDIGTIRILDNYSFVQVREDVAEKIIETLNGINFRGRPLTVNYAKSRQDEENNAAESDENNMQNLDLSDNYDSSEQHQDHPEEEDIYSDSGKQHEPG